jgi:hypothetical protein
MPKKNLGNRSETKSLNSQRHDRVESIVFHDLIRTTLSAGVGGATIVPTQFNTITTVSDAFALYRFSRLEFRLIPDGARTQTQVAGYYPGTTDTLPSTQPQVAETLSSCVLGATQTIPSEWVRLNASDLKGYLPWYKTKVGTPANEFEIQGNVYTVGSGSESYCLEIRGICELKNQLSVSQTPMVRDRLGKEDRDRLLALLNVSLPAQNTSKPAGTPDTSRRGGGAP